MGKESSKMTEPQGDSTTSSSAGAAAADTTPAVGASNTGEYQIEFIDQHYH